MRLWTIILFVIGINIGFSILNFADVWCSWGDYQTFRITENGPVPYTQCGIDRYANSTTLAQQIDPKTGKIKTSDIGWGLLNGFPFIQDIASFGTFIGLFTGIFTSIGELMQNVGFPWYIAWGLQFSMDVVIFYGLVQFILGRSGKTVE